MKNANFNSLSVNGKVNAIACFVPFFAVLVAVLVAVVAYSEEIALSYRYAIATDSLGSFAVMVGIYVVAFAFILINLGMIAFHGYRRVLAKDGLNLWDLN